MIRVVSPHAPAVRLAIADGALVREVMHVPAHDRHVLIRDLGVVVGRKGRRARHSQVLAEDAGRAVERAVVVVERLTRRVRHRTPRKAQAALLDEPRERVKVHPMREPRDGVQHQHHEHHDPEGRVVVQHHAHCIVEHMSINLSSPPSLTRSKSLTDKSIQCSCWDRSRRDTHIPPM